MKYIGNLWKLDKTSDVAVDREFVYSLYNIELKVDGGQAGRATGPGSGRAAVGGRQVGRWGDANGAIGERGTPKGCLLWSLSMGGESHQK